MNVLSVNPGRSTLGHLNALEQFGANVRVPRRQVLESGASGRIPSLAAILFPVKKMNLGVSSVLVVVRLLFAAMLVIDGIALLGGAGVSQLCGVAEMALAAFVASGFLVRALMVIPAIAFAMLASAAPDLSAAVAPAAYSAVSAVLLFAGGGWFSVDALIRVALRKAALRRRDRAYARIRPLTPDYPLAKLRSAY